MPLIYRKGIGPAYGGSAQSSAKALHEALQRLRTKLCRGSARSSVEALHEALHEALRTEALHEALHEALRTEALHEALRRLCTKLCTKPAYGGSARSPAYGGSA